MAEFHRERAAKIRNVLVATLILNWSMAALMMSLASSCAETSAVDNTSREPTSPGNARPIENALSPTGSRRAHRSGAREPRRRAGHTR